MAVYRPISKVPSGGAPDVNPSLPMRYAHAGFDLNVSDVRRETGAGCPECVVLLVETGPSTGSRAFDPECLISMEAAAHRVLW